MIDYNVIISILMTTNRRYAFQSIPHNNMILRQRIMSFSCSENKYKYLLLIFCYIIVLIISIIYFGISNVCISLFNNTDVVIIKQICTNANTTTTEMSINILKIWMRLTPVNGYYIAFLLIFIQILWILLFGF
jgi:hypothetical protein